MLTKNYGYKGAYFKGNIKDLEPTITLDWFQHCFAPTAVFIDLPDQRYFRHSKPYSPISDLDFNIVGINDLSINKKGEVKIKLIDYKGNVVTSRSLNIEIPAYGKKNVPTSISLPKENGGYLLLTELTLQNDKKKVILSRRYLRVGDKKDYKYFDYKLIN